VDTEILIYRIVGIAFLIGLPVALAFIILPARSLLRRRLRWGAVVFIGLGCMFVGLVASWPGPNTVTAVMIWGGLIAFGTGSFCLARSFCR
jgi:multisubunit Na+/H+ antiporter MnhB subunit